MKSQKVKVLKELFVKDLNHVQGGSDDARGNPAEFQRTAQKTAKTLACGEEGSDPDCAR